MSHAVKWDTNAALDDRAVERFIGRMQRRETWYLVLLSFFLINAVAAIVFGAYVAATHGTAPGFLAPAIVVEVVSLGLIAMLWRRANRMRRLGRASALPMRDFLASALDETRAAIRERKLLVGVVLLVLTPLFLLSLYRLVRQGAMTGGDAVWMLCLYLACLAVVVGVSWDRLRRRLGPQATALARLRDECGD